MLTAKDVKKKARLCIARDDRGRLFISDGNLLLIYLATIVKYIKPKSRK